MTGKLAALAVTTEKARCNAMRRPLARRVLVSTNNSIEGTAFVSKPDEPFSKKSHGQK
jgi:hypothetical protein